MAEILENPALVALPLVAILAESIFGAVQARRGLARRRFLRMAWGASLAAAAIAGLAAAAWLQLNGGALGGIALLRILALWLVPLALVPGTTLLLGSLLTLLASFAHRRLAADGFAQLPATRARALAGTPLLVSLAVFVQLVALPAWQLWPYRTLMSTGDVASVTLVGERRFADRWAPEPICEIRWEEGAPWRARFLLELDRSGRIVAFARGLEPGVPERAHHLPFEDSAYVLREGRLERVR